MKSILTVQPVLLLPPSGGENLARTIKYSGGGLWGTGARRKGKHKGGKEGPSCRGIGASWVSLG